MFLLFLSLPVCAKNIAVLPFQNLTQDAGKNWIGAGFSETLTTKLSNVKSINMIERQQLMKILDELKFQMAGYVDEKTAVEVGKMHGVDVMVLGSYQLMENTLRVSARFVDVETGKILKTTEATGNLKDVFLLQDEIAFNLMDSLSIVLAESEKQKVKENPTENLTAYEWFSKGKEADTLEDYDKAIEYLTKAIEVDDHFKEAYYFRGIAYYENDNSEQAIKDYDRAIELDPKPPAEAHVLRGMAYNKKGNYEQAIKDYDKAIELNPKLADSTLIIEATNAQ